MDEPQFSNKDNCMKMTKILLALVYFMYGIIYVNVIFMFVF